MKKILITLLVTFGLTSTAYADTCATSLMPAFTANQATALCTKLNDSIAESLVPQTTNAIDLGSASKLFRTLFLGTSLVLPHEVVAGAGTTVSDAAALSGSKVVHQITGANGTVGWKFPTTTQVGTTHILQNTTAGVAKVYAAAGGTVNGAAVDAAFSALTGIKPIVCISTGADTWICS